MFKLLIPLLLVSLVLSQDYLVNLGTSGGRTPYIDVEAFTFSDESYTVMFQASFNHLSGNDYKTVFWANTLNAPAEQDDGLIAVQFRTGSTLRVSFGSLYWNTINLGTALEINKLYSITMLVEPVDATTRTIQLSIFVNRETEPHFRGQIKGVIAGGQRVAFIGARPGVGEYLNGDIDNFVILTGVVSEPNRLSLHNPHFGWNPNTEILNRVALWIHFNDAILALQGTAVAVTKVVGPQSYWVNAQVVGGGSFQNHGLNSGQEDWKSCTVTGDPHYYGWDGGHVVGGEKLNGHYIFQTCDDEDVEIRTHTRFVQWWSNTVFRVATMRYKDYVWRMNLDETSPDGYTAGKYPNTQIGVATLRWYKHINEPTWRAIGDKTETHAETGARYHGTNGNSMEISVPDVATFTVVNGNGNYMNLYLKMNLARCLKRRGSCDGQLYHPGNALFDDMLSPPPLPDIAPPADNPCVGVTTEILDKIETACGRYFPNTQSIGFKDCKFDACASGDPDIIPHSDLTPACQLERLTGIDSSDCVIESCQGNCFGRAVCTDGECGTCDAGYGGFDCFQEVAFTCHTAKYDTISVNVEPRTIFRTSEDNMRRSFVDYSVAQSLLIYPNTYDGKEYLQFVVNSPAGEESGEFTVCLTGVDNAVAPISTLPKPINGIQTAGSVTLSVTGTFPSVCVQVSYAPFTVGGFYFETNGNAATYTIAVTPVSGLKQVLVGSQNGRGGIDVSKVPKQNIGSFQWEMGVCQNSDCFAHDENCGACYAQPGCGFCQETQRCMSGTPSGPRRGTCQNWRYEYGVSRVVTTKFDGDDLVDPNYEVVLSNSGEGVPVSVLVPTARTNSNIDIKFMFGTKGSFSINAASLKTNLLNSLFAFQQDMNLGLGYYGDAGSKSTIDLTVVDANNQYLFSRALEVPTGLVGQSTGGVFASVRKVATETGYRRFSRRLAVFTVYEIDSESTLKATRDAVLASRMFPVFLIPRGVAQNVVNFYTALNDRLDGIPSLVIRVEPSGSDFPSAFRQIFMLSASYPHVIVDINEDQYNHVDQTVLSNTADSLSIAGLTNTQIRARFLIPMKYDPADPNHHVATINIPGFGSSIIEDVPEIKPVTIGDRSFEGFENSKCIKVTLVANTHNNLASPVFAITSAIDTSIGRLYKFDATALNGVGQEVVTGPAAWNVESTYCYVPKAHQASLPASAVYESFTYIASDGCASSDPATISVFVTPLYFPPATSIEKLTISEDEQEIGGYDTIPFTIFEADKFDDGQLEKVTLTFTSLSVDYLPQIHGAAPQGFYTLQGQAAPIQDGSQYGPYDVDSVTYERTENIVYNAPADKNFFGTYYAYLTLTDNSNGKAPASLFYPVVTTVTPVNDAPTVSLNGDVFDPTGVNQWVMEDNTTAIYITGFDVDNFAIGVDLKLSNIAPGIPSLPTVNGQQLTTSWLVDACVASAASKTVICKVDYTAINDYNSCGQSNTPITMGHYSTIPCTTPAFTIDYRINDHNSKGFNWPSAPTADLTAEGSINVHVIAVNDPPVPPAETIVTLVEDQAKFESLITIFDVDSTEEVLDLYIYNLCPELVTLYQNDNSEITTYDSPVLINDKKKRMYSQDHSFFVETIENLHGTDRTTNWEICRLGSYSFDGQLPSLTDSFVSIRVRPTNDAPYDLLTYFEKNEDVNAVYNVMDLTATDVDNANSELTYVVTQLPWYDLSRGEGVVLHVIDPTTGNVDEDVYLTEDDLPYTIQLNGDDEALLWVRNLANWYGDLPSEGKNTLIYTVTDQDNFLLDGEVGYIVNTVPSTVQIVIPPVNDRPITTVQPPAGNEDMVQLVNLLGLNDKYGENDDILTVSLVAVEKIFSNDFSGERQLFYQYEQAWYDSYVLNSASVSVSDLIPLNLGDNVTDPLYRILFVPPQNMNKAASQSESPLFIAPKIQYQMIEIESHAEPIRLRSTISDWVSITVNPVNDVPVTWGSQWNVESNPSYNAFYGGNAWTYPEGHGEDATTFDNTVCVDDCYYTEDFGIVGHYLTLSPREIQFGGRDVEGDDLEVVIRSVDCQGDLPQPRNARWEMINATGRYEVATEDLVGMTLGRLVQRLPNEGYKLVSMLTFAPARNDWNVPSELHRDDLSGEESDFYCQLTYAVVDAEGFASDDADYGVAPKTITLQVRQQNDQPTDSVLQDPSQSSTLIGYEDNNLYIKFDATDVEDDEFVFNVVSCDNSRGVFYYPSESQENFITNGQLNTNRPLSALFDLSAPIDCENLAAVDLFYSDTKGKGWFVLFVSNPNDYGQDFASITVSYDDNTVAGQAPQLSDRFIDIRAVNDAPVILSGGEPAENIQGQLVVQNGNPIGLALSFEDVDALTSDGEEFDQLGFQLRVSSASLNDVQLLVKNSFTYTADGEGFIRNRVVVQPGDNTLGLVNWLSSISQANLYAAGLSVNFNYLGEYTIEIVVADNGRSGYCTPDVVLDQTVYPGDDIRSTVGPNGKLLGPQGYSESRCNRVSAVELQIKVTTAAAVIGGVATGAGAGLLALLALGAVVFAKLKKPEDLDAWQALDNAQLNNVQVSGIHASGKTGGTSALYQSAK